MAYTVPTISGCTVEYIKWSTGRVYTSGDTLPTIGANDELIVTINSTTAWGRVEYFYETGVTPSGWFLVDVTVSDNATYPRLLTSINGKPLVAMRRELNPSGYNIIPLTAKRFDYVVPSSVTNMYRAFWDCSELTGMLTINSTLSIYSGMFNGTSKPIKLKGSGGNLQALANTSSEGNVSVYIEPKINLLTQRCNSDGSLNDNGVYCLTTLSVQGDPINTTYTAIFNIAGETLTREFTLSGTNEEQVVQFVTGGALDVDTTYLCSVTVTDSWGTVRTMSDNLTTGFFTIDIQDGGKEIAFGTSANDENLPNNGLFKCGMDTKFLGNLEIKGTEFGNLFKVKEFTKDNISIAGSGDSENTIAVSMEGYTPISSLGFRVRNASSSGVGSSYANIYRADIVPSTNQFVVYARNIRTTAIKVAVNVRVLYIKSEFINL